MRNLKLIDAIIGLREIHKVVEEECGKCRISIEIERCADQLHELSLQDAKNSIIADQIIKKAQE